MLKNKKLFLSLGLASLLGAAPLAIVACTKQEKISQSDFTLSEENKSSKKTVITFNPANLNNKLKEKDKLLLVLDTKDDHNHKKEATFTVKGTEGEKIEFTFENLEVHEENEEYVVVKFSINGKEARLRSEIKFTISKDNSTPQTLENKMSQIIDDILSKYNDDSQKNQAAQALLDFLEGFLKILNPEKSNNSTNNSTPQTPENEMGKIIDNILSKYNDESQKKQVAQALLDFLEQSLKTLNSGNTLETKK
ncbi:hypothetical protein [Mesomycoplasma neurolyticum]|uniref:Lipoprotein n=1 Tax=Mesomycoplasma neurolyticum TaxID=2120 RepID=A0A449A5E9_9BACT|nr:hypothetical protein [Mesomycoplasma neurolyticum]VEU59466.1 Uncharacterised protein [Mesomycoplasma neurolyticum]